MAFLSVVTFIWAFCAYLGMRGVETLFLQQLGANTLPFSNVVLSVGMIGYSLFLLSNAKKMSGKKGAYMLSLFGIGFYSLLFLMMGSPIVQGNPKIFLVIKLFSCLLYYSLLTTLWNFIDISHDAEKARVRFGVLAAFIFMGNMAAGATIHCLGANMRGVILLIVVCFIILSFCIQKGYRETLSDVSVEDEGLTAQEFLHSIRVCLSYPHTKLLICIYFAVYFLWVIGEFSYMRALQSWLGDSNIHKYGLLFGFMGLPNIVFGLFLYKKLIGKIGIERAILLTPAVYFIAILGGVVYPSLIFATLFFIIIEGPFDILDNSNYNVMINSLPQEIRFTTRIMIEFIAGPCGNILSGLLLTFGHVDASFLGLPLAFLALGSAFLLRSRMVYHNGPSSAVAD